MVLVILIDYKHLQIHSLLSNSDTEKFLLLVASLNISNNFTRKSREGGKRTAAVGKLSIFRSEREATRGNLLPRDRARLKRVGVTIFLMYWGAKLVTNPSYSTCFSSYIKTSTFAA